MSKNAPAGTNTVRANPPVEAKAAPAKDSGALPMTWQWEGRLVHLPEWLAGFVSVRGHALHIDAPQGVISATKGEWVVKSATGDIYVSKDEHVTPDRPSSASQPSSHQAPETSA